MPDVKKSYFHGVAASLANLAAASIYSLIVARFSIDLLGKQEYGLLSLIAQIAAFTAVLDLGLTLAFSRVLIEHRNNPSGSNTRYIHAVHTATIIFNVLGAIGFLLGMVALLFGETLLSIPGELRSDYNWLMLGQSFLIFATFSIKSLSTPLIANGKHHAIYWSSALAMILNSIVFSILILSGTGIYSSLLGQIIALVVNTSLLLYLSSRYRSRQKPSLSFDRKIFKEVTSLAKDSMLWQIGGQTLGSLPIILAASWFTLNSTADLSAGLKLAILAVAACTRFGDMAIPPLSIEYAKGNGQQTAESLVKIISLSGIIGFFAFVFILCVNPSFIKWWMLGKVDWPWHVNFSAASWVAIISITQCLYAYSVITKYMTMIRWALLLECLIYISITYSLRNIGEAASLIWAKPLATLMVGIYVASRICKHTQLQISDVIPTLLRIGIALICFAYPCVYLSSSISSSCTDPLSALILNCLLAISLSCASLPILLTQNMRKMVIVNATPFINRLSGRSRP